MSSLEQKKYPIGRFKANQNYSDKDLKNLIEQIEKLPKQLKKTIGKLNGEEMDTAYRSGGWTARQVVHHIADSHMNAYIRFKLAVTEKTPIAKTYEETLWAELFDGKSAPVKVSLKLITALHKRWIVFLENLTPAQLKKGYFSPGADRIVTVAEGIALYAWHGRHHLSHIKLLTGWEPDEAEVPETAPTKSVAQKSTAKVIAPAKAASKVAAPKVTAKKEEPIVIKAKQAAPTKAKPVAEKADKPPVDRAAILVKARAAAAANRAAKGIVPKVKVVATRKNRTAAQIANDKAAAAAEKAAKPPVDRAANLAKARAVAAENRAAKGIVPKVKAIVTRKNRTPAQVAADKAAAAAEKAAKPPVDRGANLAKARAVAAENRAAKGIVPKVKPASTRVKRTPEQIAIDNAAAAAAKAAKPPVDRAANLAKARAVAAANRAAKGIVPKVKPASTSTRKNRTAEQIASDNAAADAAKAAKPPIDRAALLVKARAVAAQNRAAKGIVPKVKPAIIRKNRTAEQISSDNAAAAAAKAAKPPIDRAANLAKARAVAAENRAARGILPKPKVENNVPKLTREEALTKARATAAANRVASGVLPKIKPPADRPKLTREEALAKARATIAANRAAKKDD